MSHPLKIAFHIKIGKEEEETQLERKRENFLFSKSFGITFATYNVRLLLEHVRSIKIQEKIYNIPYGKEKAVNSMVKSDAEMEKCVRRMMIGLEFTVHEYQLGNLLRF